jgi:transposase-like protein
MKKRKRHTAAFKFKVALEALSERESLSQLASRHGIAPTQISQWKKQLKEEGPEVFARRGKGPQRSDHDQEREALYRKIGELQMQLDWLQKKGFTV